MRFFATMLVLGLSCGTSLLAGDDVRWRGTSADYQRSSRLYELTRNKVFKTDVQPHWFAGNERFWYRNDLAGGGREFILVDALKGTREAAFDVARLAAALSKVLGREVQPDHLPVDSLKFDQAPSHVLLFGEGRTWDCDLGTYELRATKDSPALETLPVETAPRATSRTGAETRITFINNTAKNIDVFWLDTAGARHHYATMTPGERHEQNTFDGHVWLVTGQNGGTLGVFEAAESPRAVVVDGTAARNPGKKQGEGRKSRGNGTSPDGKWAAFVKDNNIWLRDSANGNTAALTSDGKDDDFYDAEVFWSPDSNRLVALKRKPGEDHKVYLIESSPRDQLQPKLKSIPYLKPGDRIPVEKPHVFDIAARKEVPISDALFQNPWGISEVRWEPDSRRFTFLYNQRGHQVVRIVAVDARSGQAEAIVDEQSRTFIDYRHKKFSAYLDATHEIVWMSERDGWNHLYLYDEQNGTVKNQITRGQWVVRGVDRVDEQKRQIWFHAGGIFSQQDPYYIHYCRVNFDGSGMIVLTEGDGTHRIKYSPDERFCIDVYSRVDLPPVTELRRTDDGKRVCTLEHGDASPLLAAGWQAPERFVAKGRDGITDIYGAIFRPLNCDPARRYPVVEDIYAGPHDSFVPKAWSSYYEMQGMAELGFIVVKIDAMGTSNRSKAFHDVCWKNLGDAGIPDRILWMKAAAKAYPCMDISRVGIYGGSAGGQSALGALLEHGDFYKVAVSDCGCHDNRMDKIWWNELWMGWPVGPHYLEQSNAANAYKLKGKLFLTVGELDDNVDPSSTLQVVNALIKADKDFDLLIVPGGRHGSGELPYAQRRRKDFFVRHLLGVEPRKETGQ